MDVLGVLETERETSTTKVGPIEELSAAPSAALSCMDDFIGSAARPAAAALPSRGYEPRPEARRTAQAADEAPREPIFSVGRVQYALPAPLKQLACTSEVLLLSLSSQPPRLVRIDLNNPDDDEPIDLPFPAVPPNQRASQSIHRTFADPTGRHVLVSTSANELLYFYIGFAREQQTGRKRARALGKLKGNSIESVAWSPQCFTAGSSTREILVGTSDGRVLETWVDGELESSSRPFGRTAHDRYMKPVLQLPEKQAIKGLRFEVWSTRSGQRKRAVIFATTSTKIYQYVGPISTSTENESLFESFGQIFKDSMPKSLELPGDLAHSELHFWQGLREGNNPLDPPRMLAWLTGPGIYHGQISYSSQESGDGVIESAQLLPYPARQGAESPFNPGQERLIHEIPLSMALTEYHFILLYEDRLRVIRTLDDRIIHEEMLELPPGERIRAMTTDPVKRTYWLYSDASIFELNVRDEDREMWTVYLDRQAYDTALKFAKTPRQRDVVTSTKADAYFAQKRFVQAAELYAQSSRSFEEVVLRFIDRDERDALRNYLHSRLGRLRKSDLTQRMMLATWLVEIFLSKISHLEDVALSEGSSEEGENLVLEKHILEEDMREFLRSYKDNLDPKTTFDLIASHGRPAMMLHYASVIGDHDRIIAHHVLEEEWPLALDTLARQDDLELYYHFAPVLLSRAPSATVDILLRQPSLDPRRLIPALVATSARGEAARYLQYTVLQFQNSEAAVHNALLTLHASADDEADLLRFLAVSPENVETGRPFYDLDYALRVCKARNRVQACVQIYSKMGLYESSVDLALANADLELAKVNADKPEDDDPLRKKLWLKIARHVVSEKQDIKTAMRFLENTDLIKIEDILPFFPDFVVIDDFKEEICTALEGYAQQIERLKAEMDEATRSAEAIKSDLADLSQRFIVVDAAEKCHLCSLPLLTRQFYVFPCQHAFHADCLITEVTQHLSPRVLRRILDLQSQLDPSSDAALAPAERNALVEALTAPAQSLVLAGQGLDQLRKLVIPDALVGGIMGVAKRSTRAVLPSTVIGSRSAAVATITNGDVVQGREVGKRRTKAEAMRQELDDLLATSCVLCDLAVASLDRPFVAEGEEEI